MKDGVMISFGKDIAVILGFKSSFAGPLTSTTIAPLSANIQLGIHSLYVYTDLAEAQIVGDVRTPLLRVVAAQGNHGEYITKTYERPQYVPVAKNSADTIEVN